MLLSRLARRRLRSVAGHGQRLRHRPFGVAGEPDQSVEEAAAAPPRRESTFLFSSRTSRATQRLASGASALPRFSLDIYIAYYGEGRRCCTNDPQVQSRLAVVGGCSRKRSIPTFWSHMTLRLAAACTDTDCECGFSTPSASSPTHQTTNK